jgi:AcrR family transcriptional regulator
LKARPVALRRIHDAALRLYAEKGTSEVSVSELAQMAGVARGTIYNNLEQPDGLFEKVAGQFAEEMNAYVVEVLGEIDDPAQRLSAGIRMYVQRAHEEPHWGRFMIQFAYTNSALRSLWTGPPMQDLQSGIASSRYDIGQEQLPCALGLIGGATLSAVMLVLEGQATWRDAGTQTAMLALRSLGVDMAEANRVARLEIPLWRSGD